MASRPEAESFQPVPSDIPVGQIDVNIPPLRPDAIDTHGKIIRPSNLLAHARMARESILNTSWYGPVMKAVREHKKDAIFVTGLGVITIFVAGAGFEFGVRHGRDIRILQKMLKHGK